jgi:hypothetical protein
MKLVIEYEDELLLHTSEREIEIEIELNETIDRSKLFKNNSLFFALKKKQI